MMDGRCELHDMSSTNSVCRCARWQLRSGCASAWRAWSCLFRSCAGPPSDRRACSSWARSGRRMTERSRAAWSGAERLVPPPVDLVAKGKAQKDPDVCAKDQAILSHDLEVDPKTKGVAYGFAYLVRPKASNPAAVQDLIAKNPKVEIDQKNCDFVPHSVALHQDQTLVMKSSDRVES